MFLGFLVFAIGVIFLLQNLGYIGESAWSIIWPAIVIVAGFSMIFRPKLHGRWLGTNNKGKSK